MEALLLLEKLCRRLDATLVPVNWVGFPSLVLDSPQRRRLRPKQVQKVCIFAREEPD
jgi:hypothetical protein